MEKWTTLPFPAPYASYRPDCAVSAYGGERMVFCAGFETDLSKPAVLNLRTSRWRLLEASSPPPPRFNSFTAVFGHNLFRIGGMATNGARSPPAEAYDTSKNEWTKLPGLKHLEMGGDTFGLLIQAKVIEKSASL